MFELLSANFHKLLLRYTYRQRFLSFAVVFFLCVPVPLITMYVHLHKLKKNAEKELLGFHYEKFLGEFYSLVLEETIVTLTHQSSKIGSQSALANIRRQEEALIKKFNDFELKSKLPNKLNTHTLENLWKMHSFDGLQELELLIREKIKKIGLNAIIFGNTNLVSNVAGNATFRQLPLIENLVVKLNFLSKELSAEHVSKESKITFYASLQLLRDNFLYAAIQYQTAYNIYKTLYPQSKLQSIWSSKQVVLFDLLREYLNLVEQPKKNLDEIEEISVQILKNVQTFRSEILNILEDLLHKKISFYKAARNTLNFSLAFSLICMFILIIKRALTSHMKRLTAHIENIVNGEFKDAFCSEDGDEFGLIGKTLDMVTKSLISIGDELKELSKRLSNAILHIVQISSDQGLILQGQEGKIRSIENLAREVDAKQKLFAEKTNNEIIKTQQIASIDKLKNGLEGLQSKLNDLMTKSALIINLLVKVQTKVRSISSRIAFINKVSEGANLLSLNAAIETANLTSDRESFNAITQKVQQFAINTSLASKDIKNILDVMIASVENVKAQTLDCLGEINSGAEQLLQVNNQLTKITKQGDEQMSKFSNFSRASNEQANFTEKMKISLAQLITSNDNNNEMIRTLHDSLTDLSKSANRLQDVLELFNKDNIFLKDAGFL